MANDSICFSWLAEVDPARVGLELYFAGLCEELVAHQVERRHPGVPATGDVERGEVKRHAVEVVFQRSGDELVNLVADLVGHAHHEIGRHVRIAGVLQRVGEGIDQAFRRHHRLTVRAHHRLAVGAELVDVEVLVEHRMAEAIDDVRELRRDRRIDIHVGGAGEVDGRRDHAREFIEHDMLVFGFGAELRGLEHPIAVPFVGRNDMASGKNDRRQHPAAREGDVAVVQVGLHQRFDLRDEAIMLGMEDLPEWR